MKVIVDYPLTTRRTILSEEVAKQRGYSRGVYATEPVNRVVPVTVHIVGKKEKSPEDMCKELTGMTPTEYQLRYGVAWND